MSNPRLTRLAASSVVALLLATPVLGASGATTPTDPTLPIGQPIQPILPGQPGGSALMIESRLGFMIAAPILVYNNTGVLAYTASSGLMDIDADPLAIRVNPADPPVVILPSGGNRYLTIDIEVDNAGNLVGGVPGNDLEIFGAATIGGNTFSGLLLSGEVTEYMGTDSGGSTDFHSFRFTTSGGLLQDIFGSDVGLELVSEMSDFTGNYNVDFSGEAKGSLGAVECTGTIGDFVWLDLDGDGIQDAGEPGIGNVGLTLRDGMGNVLAMTATDGNGFYQFSGLCAGDYLVSVDMPPPGLSPTIQNAPGSNDTNDSNDPTGTPVTLPDNSSDDQDTDFGYVELGSLGDYVWNDLDMDGVQDGNEPPIEGVMVNLYDCAGNFLGTMTTDVNGFYQFTGLAAGCYQVEFILPPGFVFSPMDQTGDALDSDPDPTTGFTDPVNLGPGENNPDVDAGMYQPPTAELGDRFWEDVNGNGIQDPGEPGIPGVTVNLYDCSGNFLDSTVTGASGDYLFPDLPAGCYVIEFEPPQDCVLTLQDQGGDDTQDSDADPTTGQTTQIDLADMESDLTWDAGCYYPAGLGDFVWNDFDQDGIQDPGEPGIPGLTVILLDGDMVPTGMSTVTGAGGDYQFTGLTPGSYFVQFTAPPGFVFTLQDVGPDDTDSDANGSGKSDKVMLESGEFDPTIDAGVYVPNDPSISIEKATNGEDADNPTGPFIPNGDPVLWEYVVTNTGNVTLTGIFVTDDQGVVVDCPTDTLAPLEMMTCTGNGSATVDQYENVGDTCGTDPAGTEVCDDDPSHYFGADPDIDIEKATNGEDADDPTGPFITPGASVTWTYVVENTGNVTLSDVTVTDNQGVTVTCPLDTLTPGQIMTCTANGTAVAGQYANIGGVVGTPPPGAGDPVDDADPSHYFGALPGIDIEKATNGEDADNPTGPFIGVGGAVTWTYVVTNTGNVELTNVTVTDSQGVAVSCPDTTLAPAGEPGDSFICTANGTATAGQYENLGTVTGDPPQGPPVDDEDPSHYFGADPAIDIEKATNGEDADNPTGPVVAIGSTVNWTYLVTNTGNVPLSNVTVTDSQGVAVVCPADTLAVGGSFTCTASGIATAGQYMNNSTVVGTPPVGDPVMDQDPSHYFGADPGIDIEKATNGVDADDPNAGDAPQIAPGDPVTWTYEVTNTGNVALNDITVTDNQGVAVSCPGTSLLPGASFTCTASGFAEDLNDTTATTVAGMCGMEPATLYQNRGLAVGTTAAGQSVTDSDLSHYCNGFCVVAAIADPVYAAFGGRHAFTLFDLDEELIFTPDAGSFVENSADGTAVLSGRLGNRFNPGNGFDVVVNLTGETDIPPPGNPKKELLDSAYIENGGPVDTSTWRYYTDYTGTLVGFGAYAGSVVEISPTGPAFQVGIGANNKNILFGASSWFDYWVTSQPNSGSFPHDGEGDINVEFRDECVPDVCVPADVADHFNSNSFDNNDGSTDWSTPWIEDDVAGAGPGSGNVIVTLGKLQLKDRPDTGTNPSAAREVDLTGAVSATLSFDFSTTNEVDDSDAVTLEISNDGGATYQTLEVFTNISGGTSGSRTIDITAFASSQTRIRFRVSANYGGDKEKFKIDNVRIDSDCVPQVCEPGDVADHFNHDRYDNNDGSRDWATPWIEYDVAGDPAWAATTGNILVNDGKLQMDDRPDTGTHPSVERELNLEGYTSATLSFDFWTTSHVDDDDAVTLEISDDGGATWTTLEVFTDIDGASNGWRSYDISAFMSSETRIRFRVSAYYGGDKEHFKVDAVRVDCICD